MSVQKYGQEEQTEDPALFTRFPLVQTSCREIVRLPCHLL